MGPVSFVAGDPQKPGGGSVSEVGHAPHCGEW